MLSADAGTRSIAPVPQKPSQRKPSQNVKPVPRPGYELNNIAIESAPAAAESVETVVAEERRRGRGALTNASGRYEPHARVDEDDGWDSLGSLEAFRTQISYEKPRTVITRNDSPDLSFDRSINPYRGCEHGCVYCFARPTHAYMGLSPGLDFETRLFVKDGVAQVLERELSAPGYQPKTIAIGTNTDPYQPIERQHRNMRAILEVLSRANHPVGIVTKSALVTRDIDILAPMAAKGLAKVAISVTSLDGKLSRLMEPRAAQPQKRLDALQELSEAGIPTAALVAPIIPAINDHEIEAILGRVQAAGAQSAGYVMLRLPLEVENIFSEWLLTHFPAKYRHVMSLVRSMRGGKAYDSTFGQRMKGTGAYAWLTGRRFEVAAAKVGLNVSRVKLRCDLFKPPLRGAEQLMLL
ncbi:MULTISPECIES: PA0069 family radical SAM protein [unclassified Beijerinckia]|uniref:PA0069 family radical SAM protein n=1 Tax=unclassified Beijerinckia TaxID=2638183 RepID=UPI000896FEC4|nr:MULTISPECIES: PA0069 family radical SAM protein [unclassified Beijerinckia]MDH7797692.1 DNA repair photolyase [Beijerinckia sp. GAS462]SEC95152.1 DNA repair photolyase [Beijerinckia sp. 28-YEA-48]